MIRPTQVESMTNISMVICGIKHTVALSDNGKVWVWGSNHYGQAGIPNYDFYFDDEEEDDEEEEDDDLISVSTDNSVAWTPPQIIEGLSKIALIACGRDHTFAIIENDYVPIQFAKDDNEEALLYWMETNSKLTELDDDDFKITLKGIRDSELGLEYSLLHFATYFGSEDIVELLVGQEWMDPDITDGNGDTPLHICAERDISGCAHILLEYNAQPDLKNNIGKTAIHSAVENHAFDVLTEIVENSISNKSVVDDVGNTPLHYAIKMRHFDMAKYLLESAAQPQILDKSGKTALDYCSIKEGSYFKSLAQKNDVFISYAHVDVDFATKIKVFLESFAIKCWMDMTRLEAGSDWRLDIGNGLLSSRLVLFISSRASVVSDWCIKELHMAKKNNLVIIPIWYQKVEFDSEVRSLVFGRGFIDFSNPAAFVPKGKKLSKKLKHVLHLIRNGKSNTYLEIPVLTTEQLWEQLFLAILLESHTHHLAGCALENVLHQSAIFSCTHSLRLSSSSPYAAQRTTNLDKSWGIIFLVGSLSSARDEIERVWKYADERKKKVYLCMIHGDASDVKTEDLPAQALLENSAPIFYLQNMSSLHQLVFFIHLAQREQFMASQVGVMQSKLLTTTDAIKNNDAEIVSLKKRYYVE